MPSEVQLKVKELLEASDMRQAELADYLRVGKNTVASYLDNRWTVLDRKVLERLADVFHCDICSLLKTNPSTFFHPYQNSTETGPSCLYFRRPDGQTTLQTGRPVAYRDIRAIELVSKFLESTVDGMVSIERSVTSADGFNESAQHNCVVVGSPWVNVATELAICGAFGAQAFQTNWQKEIPFSFRLLPRTEKIPQSSIVELTTSKKEGIWLRDENEVLAADTWLPEEFRHTRIARGRDCAVVIVWNHETPDASGIRKMVVLSGLSGAGTEAAAAALVDDYRDLEPQGTEKIVWGVIEVFYRKAADKTSRQILKYNWRYRQGGRRPVGFTMKQPSV